MDVRCPKKTSNDPDEDQGMKAELYSLGVSISWIVEHDPWTLHIAYVALLM